MTTVVASAAPVGDPRASSPPLVLVYGDSLTAEAGPYFTPIARYFAANATVRVHGDPGGAICDARDAMARDARTLHPAAVVLAYTGNALTACMRDASGESLAGSPWLDRYRRDTEHAVALFRRAGAAAVYLVGTPPSWYAQLEHDPWPGRLVSTYEDIAERTPRVHFVDSSPFLLRDGAYAKQLPCLVREPCTGGVDASGRAVNQVRAPDGIHFCPVAHAPTRPCPVYASGAMRYALSIVLPVVRLSDR